MAVLVECPICHKKQSVNSRLCACGEDLTKAKKSKRVRFWINYRLPGGKQKRESVGFSIEEAKDAEGKRRSQKRENRIFDIKPDSKMNFDELKAWYLQLEKIKSLAYYPILKINLNSFNSSFGNIIISKIKPIDLENYQVMRKAQGHRNVNRKLTICDNPILTTPERCLKFEMTRVNHLIPPFCIPLFSDPLARFYSYRRLSRFAFLWSKSISDLDTP